jgi:hypothetical protein
LPKLAFVSPAHPVHRPASAKSSCARRRCSTRGHRERGRSRCDRNRTAPRWRGVARDSLSSDRRRAVGCDPTPAAGPLIWGLQRCAVSDRHPRWMCS